MTALKKSLLALHIVAGIYAGGCLSIGAVDLRYVLSIEDPDRLQEVFSALLENMGILMVPQLVIMLVLCLALSTRALKLRSPIKNHTPLFVLLGVLLITATVHLPINTDVTTGAVTGDELMTAARRWDTWHWVRTALSIVLPITIMNFYRPLATRKDLQR